MRPVVAHRIHLDSSHGQSPVSSKDHGRLAASLVAKLAEELKPTLGFVREPPRGRLEEAALAQKKTLVGRFIAFVLRVPGKPADPPDVADPWINWNHGSYFWWICALAILGLVALATLLIAVADPNLLRG